MGHKVDIVVSIDHNFRKSPAFQHMKQAEDLR
jgi:hypothetical protein